MRSIDTLAPADLRRRKGLPITSPSLTLLDLAGILAERALRQALNEARVQRIVTDRDIHVTLAAHSHRRGKRALARLLEREETGLETESEAEALCLELMVAHGLRPGETGAWIGRFRVDFLYRRERLIVEVDGYRFHGTKGRFVSDRRRTTERSSFRD